MQNISIEELKERLDKGENPILIDVREPQEHAEFNIGGRLIPLGNIRSLDIDEIAGFKEEEVILYCRSGNRSGMACQVLESAGFQNTKNLTGGMLAWLQKYGQ